MPKQTIFIQNPARITAKNKALLIENDFGQTAISFEDIWVLILESHQISISTALLSQLVDNGIGILICGNNHMPNGLMLPLGAHSRHAGIVEQQLLISRPLKKRLWQRIIQSKITNQAYCMVLLNLPCSDYLFEQCKQVLSGDTTNREAVAASYYFKHILPVGTRRNSKYTAALDYGYAILRAGIARCAVASGWLVSRGLFHDNELNAFNLVDDLLEPFRPIVDLLVIEKHLYGELTPYKKRELAKIFEIEVEVDSRIYTVQTAIEFELDSLKQAIQQNDSARLKLPILIGTNYARVDKE